jgi:Fe-S cluster assembly iron-binding protein IscA
MEKVKKEETLDPPEKATEKLKDYLQERELDSAIRIFVSQIG